MTEYDGIKSPTPQDEFDYIERAVVSLDRRQLAIEIGCFHGATTAMFAKYFDSVIAIDPFGREDKKKPDDRIKTYVDSPGRNEHFPVFMKNMEDRNLLSKIVPIIGTSDVLEHFSPLDADLIFIDDGHTYDDVKRDLSMAYRHISKEGIVIVHDYERKGKTWGYAGVAKAVNEVIPDVFYAISRTSGVIIIKK